MAGTFNKKLIQKEIFKNKTFQKRIYSLVDEEVQKEKLLFKKDFELHPVTKELDMGESATNNSGTLGGYGNLFSFLGFSKGANPTLPVKLLIQNISLYKNIEVTKNGLRFKINIPSKEEFATVTRLPWETGRSWLMDMERGISGLGAFLYGRFESSRSGRGIQSKYNYSNRTFRPVKYFSGMYAKFIKRLRVT